MGNDKSILEKFTDTVKDIASIAAEAANHALSAEEPVLKPGERAVAYMPLAADGFVGDPMMVAPIVGARKKKASRGKTGGEQGTQEDCGKGVKKNRREDGHPEKVKESRKKSCEESQNEYEESQRENGEEEVGLTAVIPRHPEFQLIDLR